MAIFRQKMDFLSLKKRLKNVKKITKNAVEFTVGIYHTFFIF